MGVSGTSREKRLVEMDVPPKLQQQLDKGLLLIGDDCLKENAEYVLEVFQTIILEWVISKEVSDKRLRKILANNPFLESLDPDTVGQLTADSRIAKSSFLGQDPYGDKPVVTEKLKEKATSKGDTDTEHSDDDGAEGPKKVLSETQLLMIAIQNKNYSYLTAHLPKLLQPSVLTRVWEREQFYEDNPEELVQTARNRMPWSEYRKAVLELLPESSGLFELMLLLALYRENNETATLWSQRVAKGKDWIKRKYGMELTDKLCWDLLGRYLNKDELINMVNALKRKTTKDGSAVTADASHKKMSAAEAKKHLFL